MASSQPVAIHHIGLAQGFRLRDISITARLAQPEVNHHTGDWFSDNHAVTTRIPRRATARAARHIASQHLRSLPAEPAQQAIGLQRHPERVLSLSEVLALRQHTEPPQHRLDHRQRPRPHGRLRLPAWLLPIPFHDHARLRHLPSAIHATRTPRQRTCGQAPSQGSQGLAVALGPGIRDLLGRAVPREPPRRSWKLAASTAQDLRQLLRATTPRAPCAATTRTEPPMRPAPRSVRRPVAYEPRRLRLGGTLADSYAFWMHPATRVARL